MNGGTHTDDPWDDFTAPDLVHRREQKRLDVQTRQRRKNMLHNKVTADTMFNTADKACIDEWKRYYDPSIVTLTPDELRYIYRAYDGSMLDYPLTVYDGSNFENIKVSLQDTIKCANHCRAWLEKKLTSMGWVMNATTYDPFTVCYSSTEYVDATAECARMAAKQALILLGEHVE